MTWQSFHRSFFFVNDHKSGLHFPNHINTDTEKLYLSNYNDYNCFVKYFGIRIRKEGKMLVPVGMVKVNPRFSYSFSVWHVEVLQKSCIDLIISAVGV